MVARVSVGGAGRDDVRGPAEEAARADPQALRDAEPQGADQDAAVVELPYPVWAPSAPPLPNHLYDRRFDAEGHRQATPDLAVDLHRDARAASGRGLGEDAMRRERLHGAVQRALRQGAGQDVGPHEEARLLDQDDLKFAARKGNALGHLKLSP
jgi:hypothetical protein